jgi:hypothetical protein
MKRIALIFLLLCLPCLSDVERDGMPIVPSNRFVDSNSTTVIVNAAGKYVGAVFMAQSTSVTGVYVYVSSTTGTAGNLKMTAAITNLDASGNPDETSVLTNGTKEITGGTAIPNGGKATLTFATPPTTTVGTIYGVIITNTATVQTSDYFTLNTRGPMGEGFPFGLSSTDGAAWTRTAYAPSIVPYYADGSLQKGFFPGISVKMAVGNDHTPDEYASVFSVASDTILSGVAFYGFEDDNIDTTGTLILKLIEYATDLASAPTTVQTVTIPALDFMDNTNSYACPIPLTAYTCHAGHTYALTVISGNTNHLTFGCDQFYAAADKTAWCGSVIYGAVRTDAGAWTTYNSGADYRVYSIIPCFTTVTTGSTTTVIIGGDTDGGFR